MSKPDAFWLFVERIVTPKSVEEGSRIRSLATWFAALMRELRLYRGDEARPSNEDAMAMFDTLVRENYHDYGMDVRAAAQAYILRGDWTYKRPKKLLVADFFTMLRRDNATPAKGETAEQAYQRGVLYGEQQAAKRNYDAAYQRGLSDGLAIRPPDVRQASDEARIAMLNVLRADIDKDNTIEELKIKLRRAERTIRRLELESVNDANDPYGENDENGENNHQPNHNEAAV